jgi:hypothetical protein
MPRGTAHRGDGRRTFIGAVSAVPTAALEKRLVHAHRARFEWRVENTTLTQACSQCYELTSERHRRKVVDGGVERWVMIKIVRCN